MPGLNIRLLDEDSLPLIVIIAGFLVSAYTILGRLQAVIWTDVLQGIALMGGGVLCLPIIVSQLPGGFAELFRVAAADNFWVSTFANLVLFGVAYFVSLLIGSRHGKDLTGLTIWRPDSGS